MKFTDKLIARIARHRGDVIDSPIFDVYRFPDTEFGLKDDVGIQDDLARLERHFTEIEAAAALFEDDDSTDLFCDLLAFRILGPRRFALPLSSPGYLEQYAAESAYRISRSEQKGRWPSSRFRIEFHSEPLEMEIWDGNLAAVFFRSQYFFSRPGIRIAPERGDRVLDCGACQGDTTLAFAAAVGPAGQVWALEPVPENLDTLKGNVARNPSLSARIEVVEKAVSNESGMELRMTDQDAGSALSESGSLPVTTISIDDFVASREPGGVQFIKFDIEGAESDALRGARAVLAGMKPRLAVSAYHRPADLWELPLLVKQLNPSYRLYLEHYTNHAEESVIYAV